MRRPTAYRHHIHRETVQSIRHTLHTRSTSGIRTHLGKIKADNHSLGNDHADALANQVTDMHYSDTTFTTGSDVSIGIWTWPYTLIFHTPSEPMPYGYTNLKTDAQKYNIKHTHTPLSRTTKHGAVLARPVSDCADFSFHKKHTSLTNIQFRHKR
jgi:hypothetical protein